MAYYVTVQEHASAGGRVAFAAGPYRRHGDAQAAVDPVRALCASRVRDGHWHAYGTARDRVRHDRVGRLNGPLGVTVGADGFVS